VGQPVKPVRLKSLASNRNQDSRRTRNPSADFVIPTRSEESASSIRHHRSTNRLRPKKQKPGEITGLFNQSY
jgi:hypothetical protein